jgi:DNA-binding NtrC family response regulator
VQQPSKHLLLVEDEGPLRQLIAAQLAQHGYEVQQSGTGEDALAKLSDFAFDLIVTDLRLPGMDGSAVVDAAVARYPDIVAVVVTGYGTVKDAVEAIKRGAWDFVSKPFQIDELLHVLDAALEQRRLKSENAYLRAQLEDRYRFDGLVGKTPAMIRLFQLLETIASANSTVLISGETGTGKELVARAIHATGRDPANRPMVSLNLAALPATLLESELFGYAPGTFTGDRREGQAGKLEQAEGGTLFLDEVADIPMEMQVKLLRVLEDHMVERLGSRRAERGTLPCRTSLAGQRAPVTSKSRGGTGVLRWRPVAGGGFHTRRPANSI